jgi:hypothetical protein
MKPGKNAVDKNKKETAVKKSVDAVETPTPPQHMDPSEKPKKGEDHSEKKSKK